VEDEIKKMGGVEWDGVLFSGAFKVDKKNELRRSQVL
jgi:hypothetical protein